MDAKPKKDMSVSNLTTQNLNGDQTLNDATPVCCLKRIDNLSPVRPVALRGVLQKLPGNPKWPKAAPVLPSLSCAACSSLCLSCSCSCASWQTRIPLSAARQHKTKPEQMPSQPDIRSKHTPSFWPTARIPTPVCDHNST